MKHQIPYSRVSYRILISGTGRNVSSLVAVGQLEVRAKAPGKNILPLVPAERKVLGGGIAAPLGTAGGQIQEGIPDSIGTAGRQESGWNISLQGAGEGES